MADRHPKLSTEQKALEINLDEQKYGTIVEIGAGQGGPVQARRAQDRAREVQSR